MKDEARTKKDLVAEPVALRRRVSDLDGRGNTRGPSLQKNGGDFRDLVDHVSDGVFRIDRDGYFTFVNKGMTDRAGIPPETFYSLHFLDPVVPEDRERARNNFEKVLRGEAASHYELSYKRSDGRVITVEINMSAIYDGEQIVGVQGISRDLTARKLVEETVRKDEERFRKMVQNSMDALSLFSPEGTFLYISEAVDRILGYRPEEMIGQRWEQFVHPDDVPMMVKKLTYILEETGNIETAEMRARHRDGYWRWIDIVGNNQVGDPEVGAIILNFRDITDKKLAEEAITESESRFEELFESMSSCMAVYEVVGDGEDFVFKAFNKSAEKADRIQRDALIGKSVREVFPGVEDMGLFDIFRRVSKTGTAERYPATVYKDGRIEGWRENYVYKLPSGEIVAIYDDLTEQKRAEMAARESEERFRSLFDHSLECIYIHDLEGRMIDANQAGLHLLGYDRKDIPSIDLRLLFAPEQLTKAWQQLKEMQRTGPPKETTEYQVKSRDGTLLDFETKASLVYHDDEPYAIMVIARDITEKKQNVARLRQAVGATVQAMAIVVEARDPYTAGHQRRVADLARSIATEMGLSHERIDGIRTAASIHDIGKISVPAEILSKPTRLSETEYSLIQIHPQSGYDILKNIDFPWPVARMVLEHHERMDGSGYPNGLREEEILLESRIIAVADVVEAVASYRPYRSALGVEMALEEITKGRGTTLDSEAVDACLRLFTEKGYTFLADQE